MKCMLQMTARPLFRFASGLLLLPLLLSGCASPSGEFCDSAGAALCYSGGMAAMTVAVPLGKIADTRERAAQNAIQGPPRPSREQSFAALVRAASDGDLAAQMECVDRCHVTSLDLQQAAIGYAAQQSAAQQLLHQAERQPGSVDELTLVVAYLRLAREPGTDGRAVLRPDMIRSGWTLARAWTPERLKQFSARKSVYYAREYQQQMAAAMFLLHLRALPADRQSAEWQGCVSSRELPVPAEIPALWSRLDVCATALAFDDSPRSIESGRRVVPREVSAQWLQDEARVVPVTR